MYRVPRFVIVEVDPKARMLIMEVTGCGEQQLMLLGVWRISAEEKGLLREIRTSTTLSSSAACFSATGDCALQHLGLVAACWQAFQGSGLAEMIFCSLRAQARGAFPQASRLVPDRQHPAASSDGTTCAMLQAEIVEPERLSLPPSDLPSLPSSRFLVCFSSYSSLSL